jgi:hypothetical protein
MNILLWVLQIVLAVLSIAGGIFQIFKIAELQKTVAAMRALPRGLWAVLGTVGCVAGVGLILPGLTNALPGITPIAAAVVAATSLLISAFYITYHDYAPLPYSLAMLIMAAIIFYGRSGLMPF